MPGECLRDVALGQRCWHKAKTSGVNRQEEVTSGSQFLVPELAVDSVESYPSPSLLTFVL